MRLELELVVQECKKTDVPAVHPFRRRVAYVISLCAPVPHRRRCRRIVGRFAGWAGLA